MDTTIKAFDIKNFRDMLIQADVPSRLPADDCFGFRFEALNLEGADELAACLQRLDVKDSNFEQWITEAIPFGLNLVAVRRVDDEEFQGFVTYDIITNVKHHEDDNTVHVRITILANSVYVTPGARGRGFGNAIAELVADQFRQSLSRMKTFFSDAPSSVKLTELRIGLEAECISLEGARTVEKIYLACAAAVEEFKDAELHWPGFERLNVYVDWSGWLPECDLHQLHEARSGAKSLPTP